MTSIEQIKREAKSRVYLSNCSQMDMFRIESKVLSAFNGDGKLTNADFENYYVAIRSLKDSAYLRCGISNDFMETYKTTDAGREYLARINKKLDVLA